MAKLRIQLIIAFLSAVIVPLVIVTLLTLSEAERYAKNSFEQSFLGEVKQIDNGLSLMFKLLANNLSYLSQDPRVSKALPELSQYMDKPASLISAKSDSENKLYQMFATLASHHPDVSYLYLGTAQGGYLQWPQGNTTDFYDPRVRPWYKAAVAADGEIVRAPAYYWAADNAMLMSTVKLLKDPEQKPLGVIGIDITLTALTQMLKKINFGYQGSLLVVENTGRILADTRNPDNIFKPLQKAENGNLAILTRYLEKNSGQIKFNLAEQDYLATLYHSPKLDWQFIGMVPQRAINQHTANLTTTIICIALVSVIAFSLMAYFLSRYLANLIEHKQKQLRQARQQAEDASQAKSQFLANMSHEIRTPLNGVLGMTQLLASSQLKPEHQQKLQTIERSGKLLMGIINDILDFSKIEAEKLELSPVVTDLHTLIAVVAQSHQANAAMKQVELIIDCPDIDENSYFLDDIRLSQVLGNLLSNAIKFTEQGQIILSCHQISSPQTTTSNPTKHRLKFSVKDSGIGLTPEQAQHIFDAFQQADGSTTRKYGGTGLGLALCRAIIKEMGGELKVNSEPGQGSEFYFELDCLVRKPEQPLQQNESLVGKTMVIVDDIQLNHDVLNGMAQIWHMNTVNLTDPFDAISWFKRENNLATVDYLILDYAMPHYTGPALLKLIKHLLPAHCRSILLSSMELDSVLEEANEAGINSVLNKPVMARQLLDQLCYVNPESNKQGTNSARPTEISSLTPTASSHATKDQALAENNKILVVEDNDINFMVVEQFLLNQGYQVDWAQDGEQAVRLFKQGQYTLVLMDCMLPVMNGYQATEKIRQYEQEMELECLAIIALTADVTSDNKQRCLDAGMNDYVAKPFNLEELQQVIERYLKSDKKEVVG